MLISADLCTGKASKAFGHAMKSSVTRIADRSSPFMSNVVNLCACLINMYNFKILIINLYLKYVIFCIYFTFCLECFYALLQLLMKENLDLKLTPYKVLATSGNHGQFSLL